MSEFDDIVPTISRNSAQSAQSRTVSERRSTLYMIPKEEQQLMHLFSQSSDLIPQMGGDLQPTTPVDEVLEAARAAAEAAAEEAANTDDELRFGAVYGRGSYSVQNQLISASKFAYNAHNESIFDDENLFPTVHHNAPIVKFDEANPDIINHATLKALIVQQTSPEIIDYNLICDFFLTYRTFVSSIEVMELLLTRIMWSLQYIASQQEENITIGKLVLLRTFVALRHWILNYFIDDFVNVTTNSPSLICDIFVNFINQITHESEFVTESMIFENKIFTDLKIHWLTQLNEFWDTKIDIDVIGKKNILMYQLPIVSTIIPRATSMKRGGSSTGNSGIYKLLKSNTDMSIHTNPSFRRSAMLSLYDQKAHHKCLIYEDGAINDENPQMSINNLLLHHKSSRQSINNQLYLLRKPNNSNNCNNTPGNNSGIVSNCTSNSNSIHNNLNFLSNNTNNNNNNSNTTTTNNNNTNNNNNNNPKKRKPLTLVSHKHNHINLQDSSVGLKKTTKNTEIKEYSDKIDNNDDKENNEIDGDSAKVLNNNFPVGGGIVGFSTNGSCKLPTARVENILPNTPVKKMDYFVKSDQVDDLKPPVPFIDNDIGRKTSIKKFVDNWKKSFHVPEGSGNAREIAAAAAGEAESEGMISDSVESTNAASMPIANSRAIIGSRVDILSARIIDELEYLIRYYIQQEPTPNTIPEDNHDELENEQSIDIMSGSPHKKQLKQPILKDPLQASLAQSHRSQQVHVFNDSNEELPEHDIDISDLMIQNNSDLTEAPDLSESFQRPASINWNESLENSQEVKDDEESIDIDDELVFDTTKEEREAKSGTQYFDVSSEFQVEGEGHRDIDDVDVDVDAESNFVSLRDSDNSFQSTISTPSNITQYDEDVTDLGIVLSPQLAPIQQRVQHKPHKLLMAHLGPLHHKRISFNEANINYNQKRLSIISRTSSSSIFKRDSVKSYISYDLIFSSSNGSVKKSVGDDEGGFLRKKTGYNNLRIAGIGATGITHSSHIFDNRQSFASCTSSVRKSIRFSTLFALTELPFNNLDDSKEDIRLKTAIVNGASGSKSGSGAVRTLKLLDVADSSIFSVAIKCKSAKVASGGSSERNSVAIPGISNYVLKELAAIPDESFRSSNDPVEMALSKLEGKEKQNKKQLEDVSFDNTQDILNEINNANTKDVIELDDEFGFNQEEPLTPKKMSIGSLGITSTPNHTEMIEDSMIGNEEEQKEEYEDGAEDEEEDEEEEEQEREGEGEGEGEEQHDEEQENGHNREALELLIVMLSFLKRHLMDSFHQKLYLTFIQCQMMFCLSKKLCLQILTFLSF